MLANRKSISWISLVIVSCILITAATQTVYGEDKAADVKKAPEMKKEVPPVPVQPAQPVKPAQPAPVKLTPAPVKPAIVNTTCPITGKTINPAKTPDTQTVVYKGQKVRFCSVDCVAAWKKLTDNQKDAKLKAATKPVPAPVPAKPEVKTTEKAAEKTEKVIEKAAEKTEKVAEKAVEKVEVKKEAEKHVE